MKIIEDSALIEIVGGDSFWEDLGEFVGGFAGSFSSGIGGVTAVPLQGAVTAGLLAAAIN
jgi:hypothetical protein